MQVALEGLCWDAIESWTLILRHSILYLEIVCNVMVRLDWHGAPTNYV
jgi:hypothetical protein